MYTGLLMYGLWSVVCWIQQERLDIEEKYSSLQEEVAGKTKKLKKVWTMYMQAKSEVLCGLMQTLTDVFLSTSEVFLTCWHLVDLSG